MTEEEKIKALVDSFDIALADIVTTELAKVKAVLDQYLITPELDDKKTEGGETN